MAGHSVPESPGRLLRASQTTLPASARAPSEHRRFSERCAHPALISQPHVLQQLSWVVVLEGIWSKRLAICLKNANKYLSLSSALDVSPRT
eukprot:5883997-Amphidinium_carterae.1